MFVQTELRIYISSSGGRRSKCTQSVHSTLWRIICSRRKAIFILASKENKTLVQFSEMLSERVPRIIKNFSFHSNIVVIIFKTICKNLNSNQVHLIFSEKYSPLFMFNSDFYMFVKMVNCYNLYYFVGYTVNKSKFEINNC